MTSDYYSILGVTPAAQDVVISAAYRALMRHYHPDTNSDPEAQERAREITAAFAVLRDPARRAEYDAHQRAGGDLWFPQELRSPPDRPPAPAMRTAAIGSAALALALVAIVWAWPQPDRRAGPAAVTRVSQGSKPRPAAPVVELEPESERLARLHRDSSVLPTAAELEAKLIGPPIEPPAVVPTTTTVRVRESRRAPTASGQVAASAPMPTAPPARTAQRGVRPAQPPARCEPGSAECDRLAALDRMATGFFSQSMVHANAAKQSLLLSARNRAAVQRSTCRSDACVTDANLKQMREISAIMEGRAPPEQ